MTEQLKGYEWERFSAIDGLSVNIKQWNQMGFHECKVWKDPITNNSILINEICCFISHYSLWEKCFEMNENFIILEDDSELKGKIDFNFLNYLLNYFDIVYLDYLEMLPDISFQTPFSLINENLVHPVYPYWANAYAISPRFSKKILESNVKNNIIPVDELLPILQKNINVNYLSEKYKKQYSYLEHLFKDVSKIYSIAFKTKIFNQIPRNKIASDLVT